LNGVGKFADFRAIIDIGRRHMERQQMAERVDRHVKLGAALAFGAVIAGPRAAFRSRTQGPTVDDRRGRILLAML
jgi:hypothetical protein